jgi:nucleoside-diphosphate-sugar epimerase
MRIFLAGATGVIGIRLVPLLVADHTVAGMTRSPEKIEQLQRWGPSPSFAMCSTRAL